MGLALSRRFLSATGSLVSLVSLRRASPILSLAPLRVGTGDSPLENSERRLVVAMCRVVLGVAVVFLVGLAATQRAYLEQMVVALRPHKRSPLSLRALSNPKPP